MSTLLPTGLSVQPHVFGLSSSFDPPAKLSSLLLPYASVRWKVVEGSRGTPAVVSTLPPLPDGPGTQSPTLFAVVVATLVFASRSPSIPKPPVGTPTGTTPTGGVIGDDESVKVVLAVKPEEWPVAVARKPWPRKLCWIRKSLLEKLPPGLAVAETLPTQKIGSTLVSEMSMLTLSPAWKPVPVKVM